MRFLKGGLERESVREGEIREQIKGDNRFGFIVAAEGKRRKKNESSSITGHSVWKNKGKKGENSSTAA